MSRFRIAVILGVILVVLGIYVIAGGAFDGQSSDDDETVASTTTTGETEQPLSAEQERGRELFVDNCGQCHTLDAAGTNGSVGPNLDEAQNDEQEVLTAIEQGGNEPGGPMPQNIVEGDDAKAVAKFVSSSGPGV